MEYHWVVATSIELSLELQRIQQCGIVLSHRSVRTAGVRTEESIGNACVIDCVTVP